MKRWLISGFILLLFASCTSDQPRTDETWGEMRVESAPWTIKVPPGWAIDTEVFEPGPRDRVGMMTTAVSSVSFRPDEDAPSPNARGGAASLRDDAAIVLAKLLWIPEQHKRWDPPGTELRRFPPSRWHDDAQNPGWRFRERKLCIGSRSCVSILEWHAPNASAKHLDWMEEVASTVELASL